MNLFFGKAKTKATPKDAIYKLRENLSMLEKRQAYLETKADNELKIAKVNATKNKRAALMALKRKKVYEQNIEKIDGARMTIETQIMAIENANVNLETYNAMRAGADVMKNMQEVMNVDKVDATMDDIREHVDTVNEISDVFSRPINLGDELDEDELLEELEKMEQEELDAKMLETPSPVITAPNVPMHVPASKNTVVEDDEEEELAMLRASMS